VSRIDANGCQVVRHKKFDQSISVVCPKGHCATLHWSFLGHSKPTITIDSAHALRYQPTIVTHRHVGIASFNGANAVVGAKGRSPGPRG
jgi:hypothetical protein